MGLLDFMYKPKYKIVFLRREHNAVFIHTTRIYNDIKTLEGLKEKKYIIDVNTPAYISKNIYTFFVDMDNGSQMAFSEIERQMSPEELDMVVGTKIIRELTKGVMDNSKDKILWAIIGFVIGALLGFLVMQLIMSSKIEELLMTMEPITPTLPTIQSAMSLFFGGG